MRFSGAIFIIVIVCKCNTRQLDGVPQEEKEYNELNSESCKPSLLNLTFSESNTKLNATWDLISPSEKCDYEYRINLTDISAENTSQPQISQKISTTSYQANSIKPCGRYNVSVEVFERDKLQTLATLTDIFNSTIALHQVNNLNLTTTTNGVRLFWEPSVYVDRCNIYYYVTSISALPSKDIPYFRQETRTEHWIGNLNSCTRYNVSITPTSIFQRNYDDDNDPNLVYTISTLPDKVNQLSLHVYDNGTEISWKPPQNQDCLKEYRIVAGNNSISTNALNIVLPKALYCTDVAVEAVTFANHSGAAVFAKKPGPVRNLRADPSSTTLRVAWEEPLQPTCVADYEVQLVRINDNIDKQTSSTEYTFSDLTACSEYEVKVAARTVESVQGDFSSYSAQTGAPEELVIKMMSYILNPEENIVIVSWHPPTNTSACIITYILEVHNDEGTEIFKQKTTDTTYDIPTASYIGCMNYSLSIKATTKSSVGAPVLANITVPKAAQAPSCEVENVDKTWAILKCSTDSYEANKCPIQELFANCTANSDEGRWVIPDSNNNRSFHGDEATHSLLLKVENISEFTNYSCTATVTNSAKESLPSEPVKFRTKAGVPSAPTITGLGSNDSMSFYVTWDEPETIPGNLEQYRITVDVHGPLYFLPLTCYERGKNQYIHIVPQNTTTHTFTLGFPSYNYTVFIEAKVEETDEYGPPSETKVIHTKGGVPEEPPRHLNLKITQIAKDYKVNVDVYWIYPCYTNGIVREFEVSIWGIPLVDLHVENDTRTSTVPLNGETLDYKYNFSRLQPAFKYLIGVTVVTEDNLRSDSAQKELESPEGLPEAPKMKQISEVTRDTFTIEWDKPNRQNGVLQNYTIFVESKGPGYWVPKDCSISKPNYTDSVSPDKTTFKFENGDPDYKYEARVVAKTSAGSGDSSGVLRTQTSEAEPEPVRTPSYKIVNLETEDYNASLEVTFKHPCHTNGLVNATYVILLGTRPNHKSFEIKHSFKSAKDNYLFVKCLRAEYKYTLSVQVETYKYKSEKYEVEFVSPSGVPPVVAENVTTPTANGTSQAIYDLPRDLFDSEFGDILYYSVIIGEVNRHEESKFGFWNGDDGSWPTVSIDAKSNEELIQPYEATPRFWNPFEGSDSTNFTVVLGDGSLSESNRPLQVEITYTFKVRGFTRQGYRDTHTVTFHLPVPPEEAAALGLILGLLFGIIGTVLILMFIFILWRKRQQWAMKKESIKSIPLTPIPVSIKLFPDYYNELKHNSERLKHEYMLLVNQSNEVALPAYDGMLPENKKKNRYTNIIPYDQTRVKLVDTNDNYSYSDYINASYIQGYSSTIEYIATQGPLEHTCIDFWKMVIQENVSLIIMVAQFVEQNKEKCFKYFPDNHENLELENGIAIRCCTELNFNSYTVRTLLVQKDLQQWTVTHLQFTEWPDFGCPTGTEVMLEFCQLMREYAERNSDPVIIHCSAGVGRTGTLVALDIILQGISNKRDIDVFGTVMNLRRDRKNMVQTEKQYLYIHSCINDAIENPVLLKNGDIVKDPIYENLEDIKKEKSDDVKESQF